MDTHPKATPKDFFLWAGAMLALYGGVIAFITLLFNYINHAFPDPLRYTPDPYSGGMPYQMASLIILAPLFLILMRIIRAHIVADPTRADVWVRRWALFLTVFIAGASIVVDLIILLTTYLGGESLTAAFLLKVLVVLLVVGAGFLHFLADLRGYWNRNVERAKMVNWGMGGIVIVAIVAGFFIVGTPSDARLARLDQRKVNDLSSIQWQIVNYYQQTGRIPASLRVLADPLSGFIVPVDPQSNESYEYTTLGNLSFELCADFNQESNQGTYSGERAVPVGVIDENWAHGGGRTCFERTIDPDRFPPLSKRL